MRRDHLPATIRYTIHACSREARCEAEQCNTRCSGCDARRRAMRRAGGGNIKAPAAPAIAGRVRGRPHHASVPSLSLWDVQSPPCTIFVGLASTQGPEAPADFPSTMIVRNNAFNLPADDYSFRRPQFQFADGLHFIVIERRTGRIQQGRSRRGMEAAARKRPEGCDTPGAFHASACAGGPRRRSAPTVRTGGPHRRSAPAPLGSRPPVIVLPRRPPWRTASCPARRC